MDHLRRGGPRSVLGSQANRRGLVASDSPQYCLTCRRCYCWYSHDVIAVDAHIDVITVDAHIAAVAVDARIDAVVIVDARIDAAAVDAHKK